MHDYRNEIRRLMITVNQVEGLYYSAAKMLGIKENTLTLLYALDDGKCHLQKQICDDTKSGVKYSWRRESYVILICGGTLSKKSLILFWKMYHTKIKSSRNTKMVNRPYYNYNDLLKHIQLKAKKCEILHHSKEIKIITISSL